MGIFSRSSTAKKHHNPLTPLLSSSAGNNDSNTSSGTYTNGSLARGRGLHAGISASTSSVDIVARTLSSTNLDITDGRLGLNLLNSDDRKMLTYIMLDQADRLGDDDENINIVDKVAEEESDSSDDSSDEDEDRSTSISKKTTSTSTTSTASVNSHDILLSPPPRYNSLAPLMPRYRITPREEEGHETLPRYRSVIFKEALLERKQEMTSPFDTAPSRKWKQVHAELNNTQLSIFAISTIGRGGSAAQKFTDQATDKTYKKKGLIKTYTLQYADIGLADDYKKKQNAIRIRAESEQFLLAAGCEQDCVEWARCLQMGSEIALPLEERKLPKLRSIPRRRNRHRRRERREEERMSRELMLRPYSSRMSTVSVGSNSRTPRRPSMNTRNSSGGTSMHESGTVPLRPAVSQHTSSVHFRTPKQHPRRNSQPSMYPGAHPGSYPGSYGTSLLSPIPISQSVYMYDDTDFSDDDEDPISPSSNLAAQASERRNAIAEGTTSTTGTNSTVTGGTKESSNERHEDQNNSNSNNGDNSTNGHDGDADDDDDGGHSSGEGSDASINSGYNDDGIDESTSAINDSTSSVDGPRISLHGDSQGDGEEDDDDSEADVPLARTTTQATTTSMTFTFGYKWNPAKLIPSAAQLTEYTKRCLVQLAEDAPWTDKKIIKDGVKYIVRDGRLERVSSSVPPTT